MTNGFEPPEWTWPKRPSNPAELNEMMEDLDRRLAAKGLMPASRSLEATRLVSIALGLSGTPILGYGVTRGEAFSPSDILARVFDWYNETYGDRNKIDFALGYIVIALRGTYWTLRIPLGFGFVKPFASRNLDNAGRSLGSKTEPASYNVLTGLTGITQAFANRLTSDELTLVLREYMRGHIAMASLDEMRGHPMFEQAKGDYKHSVDALSAGQALSKARWDTAQCAEKVFKGLLGRADHPFPKSGSKGHDIVHLGGLVTKYFGAELPEESLRAIHCPTIVRYGEINVDLNEAWTSHIELLNTLCRLRPLALLPGEKRLRG